MTAPDLLPCPFCGGEAHIEQIGDRRQSTIYCCNSCGCRLETGEEWDHGRDWNTRATPATTDPKVTALVEAVKAGLPYFAHLGWCNSKDGRDCNCGHDEAYAAILRAMEAEGR